LRDGLFASLSDHLDPRLGVCEAFRPYATDPVGFVREVLGADPWHRQEAILRALATEPRVTVRSGHGVGKTFTAACAALWFLHCHSPCLVLTTAPTQRQVRKLLWGEINVLWRKSRTPLPGRCLTTEASAGLEQHAYGFTADNPEGAAGAHSPHVLCILDEASGIAAQLLETLHGALTSAHTVMLMIGNPTRPSGPFYDSHRSPEWNKFKLSCLDTPNLLAPSDAPPPCPWLTTAGWVESRKREWGEDSIPYMVRVLGDFPPAGDTTLFSLADLEATLEVETDQRQPIVLGVDVARFGDCETVVAVRHGNQLSEVQSWQGLDTVQSKGRVLDIVDRVHPSQIVVDTVGLGAGLFDELRACFAGDPALLPEHRRRVELVSFVSGSRPLDPVHHASRRDEAYWRLSELIRTRTLRFAAEFPRLVAQLTELTYSYTAASKIHVETKDDLRRRGVSSPDHADAVCLAFSQAKAPFHRPTARGSVRPT
jgi:phage terminase large subunit